MKSEHKDLNPTELALLTWYKPDNPLYKNPEPAVLGLAEEIGELLGCLKKDKYKPGFDWLRCKKCKEVHPDAWTLKSNGIASEVICENYISTVLDELGDTWYYLRILAWMYNVKFLQPHAWYTSIDAIKNMYHHADNILNGGEHSGRQYEIGYRLQCIYDCLVALLDNYYTIEELTELNYYKLNSEPSNHGWKDAR